MDPGCYHKLSLLVLLGCSIFMKDRDAAKLPVTAVGSFSFASVKKKNLDSGKYLLGNIIQVSTRANQSRANIV